MSRLVLVRHAQASFSSDPMRAFADYDRLSPLGVRQAESLGEELAAAGTIFDRVYAGPSERHRETAEAVGRAYAGTALAWPGIEVREGFAEHEGAHVVRRALERPEHAEEHARLVDALERATSPGDSARAYLGTFQRVTRRWVRGELAEALSDESWPAFRARVGAQVRHILAEAGRGATVAVFTSGGPIGSTVAWALGLADEQALELAWIVENATVTELLHSDGRVSLKSFNAQSRLGRPEFVTHV
jgi:broad specificity phosphatase PhoE